MLMLLTCSNVAHMFNLSFLDWYIPTVMFNGGYFAKCSGILLLVATRWTQSTEVSMIHYKRTTTYLIPGLRGTSIPLAHHPQHQTYWRVYSPVGRQNSRCWVWRRKTKVSDTHATTYFLGCIYLLLRSFHSTPIYFQITFCKAPDALILNWAHHVNSSHKMVLLWILHSLIHMLSHVLHNSETISHWALSALSSAFSSSLLAAHLSTHFVSEKQSFKSATAVTLQCSCKWRIT